MKTFIDKLGWIYLKDRKLLSVKNGRHIAWLMPGGKREKGETDEEAVIREIMEELSVDLVKKTIKPYGVFEAQAFGKPEGTMVRITCYTAGYLGTLKADNEIKEICWINYEDKADSTDTGRLILEDLKKKNLID